MWSALLHRHLMYAIASTFCHVLFVQYPMHVMQILWCGLSHVVVCVSYVVHLHLLCVTHCLVQSHMCMCVVLSCTPPVLCVVCGTFPSCNKMEPPFNPSPFTLAITSDQISPRIECDECDCESKKQCTMTRHWSQLILSGRRITCYSDTSLKI